MGGCRELTLCFRPFVEISDLFLPATLKDSITISQTRRPRHSVAIRPPRRHLRVIFKIPLGLDVKPGLWFPEVKLKFFIVAYEDLLGLASPFPQHRLPLELTLHAHTYSSFHARCVLFPLPGTPAMPSSLGNPTHLPRLRSGACGSPSPSLTPSQPDLSMAPPRRCCPLSCAFLARHSRHEPVTVSSFRADKP